MIKKLTFIVFVLGIIFPLEAQNLLEPKQRVLKPQTPKSFSYQVTNAAGSVSTTKTLYSGERFLKKLYSENEIPSEMVLDPKSNLPIEIKIQNPVKVAIVPNSEMGIGATLLENLEVYATWMQVESVSQEFKFLEILPDPLGKYHFKFQQVYQGVEVYGGQIIIHESDGYFDYMNGSYYPSPKGLNTVPKLDYSQAEQKVIKDIKRHTHYRSLSEFEQKVLGYTKPESELVIYHLNRDFNTPKLVYHITIRPNFLDRYEYFVDAQTGEIINHYDNTCAIKGSGKDLNNQTRDVECYQSGSTFYMINTTKSMFNASGSTLPNDPKGAIWTIDAQNTDGDNLFHVSSTNKDNWADASAVSAHYNGAIAFDYFKNVHGRNSINGLGGNIVSVVNVTREGAAMDNAYWNGSAMFYGNGKTSFYPLAGSLDVAGHEMTHGVVQNTAGLEYNGQSGAINESMADIFGVMMDRSDWKIGEDIIKSSAYLNGALRDMSNPHQGRTQLFTAGYQPMNMSEYYSGTEDNSGVHINSGIVNHAFYKFATAVTMEKAEKIYYRALTLYLTQSSQFLNLRLAIVKATEDLYGQTESDAAKAAFDFVEIYNPNGNGGGSNTGDGDDLPQHPGTAKLILYSTDNFDNNTIYKANADATNFEALSTVSPKSRMSVRDDGKYAYYVATNKTIREVNLTNKTEIVASSSPIWSNVAISPDGTKLAAVTEEDDTAIWVYDFIGASWMKYTLYNPSNAGIKSYTVDYADALEWNYSSEYVMYDAQNTIGNNSYFDIGFLKAWDNDKNTFGDGAIEKVFSSIPDGVSVGNATFSKNSPYIIALDYIDNNKGIAYAAGLNINSDELFAIFSNSVLNFPSYSMDDKTLAFTATSNGNSVIATIGLAANKIEASGNASGLIGTSEKPVYYGVGTRALLSDKKDLLSFELLNLDPQITGSISGTNVTLTVPFGTNVTALRPTFTHSSKSKVLVSGKEQISGVSTQNFSTAKTYTVQAEDKTTKNYTVNVTFMSSSIQNLIGEQTSIYPNPTNSILNVEYPGAFKYSILSVQGKELSNGKANGVLNYSTDRLTTGIYFIRLDTDLGRATFRFIVE